MDPKSRSMLICSCEGTMPLDTDAIARGCGAEPLVGRQLCRAEIDRVRSALSAGGSVTIGCTQEARRFEDLAEDTGHAGALAFANLRETGGWSGEASQSGPKMAALLAAAAVPAPPPRLVTLESRGIALVLAEGETGIEAAQRLADHLDISVLLRPGAGIHPPRRTVFPVLQGIARRASGHLGAFEVSVDAMALPDPSARGRLTFGPASDGKTSRCDLILDLTGETPLFPAWELRDGYLRADPRNPVAVERAIFDAAQLVGTFDRPAYVSFDKGLCAHSRSGITGCTRCLDLCPTGAITSAGDHVAIDPDICAGCGQCAAACPTGAVAYALPKVDVIAERLRAMMRAYLAAGGAQGIVLFHDGDHGEALIDACARLGPGLPARVLPLAVNEVSQIGPEALAAAMAWGAAGIRILMRARPRHDPAGLRATLDMTGTILTALGYGSGALATIETDDPDTLAAALRDLAAVPDRPAPSGFLPPRTKRALLEHAFRELHRVAPAPVERIDLDPGAPFGAVVLDRDACTLCLACVSACPVQALSDNPDLPMLRFTESLCLQCGLCAETCPEDAITLAPRIDIAAWDAPHRVLHQEEPFCCTKCGKAFGSASTIARVREKLTGHWMFSGPDGERRRAILELCEDCRVGAVMAESFDPHDPAARKIRTTADYLRERAGKLE